MSYRESDMNEHRPYEDLYIYLIEGQVSEGDEIVLGDAFLGNWVEDNSAFLFFSEPSKGLVDTLLRRRKNLTYIDEYHLPYEQWQGGILEPIRIEPLIFIPPWVKFEPAPDEIKIVLDPGVVFGNGLHPTTTDCIGAMIYLKEKQTRVNKVLDIGTGTGILALVAGFLGADDVTAIDPNPLAVKTAKRNVLLNHLEGIVNVIEGKAQEFVNHPADLVIANIHHAVIERLFTVKNFREKKRFIISGLMRSQIRDLKSQITKCGLKVIREWDHEMTWYTMLLDSE
jgi:ribosomal protein L11 methyltransferase